jgi:hypothetical protein
VVRTSHNLFSLAGSRMVIHTLANLAVCIKPVVPEKVQVSALSKSTFSSQLPFPLGR